MHFGRSGGIRGENNDDLAAESTINTPTLLSLFGYRSASIGPFVRHYGLYEHQIPERTTVLQWRRFCYEYNLFAVSFDPPVMPPHRSLDFYRQNAGHLNELKRWLRRETLALSNVVDAVITPQQIETVLDGVELCDIDSEEFLFFVPPLEPKTTHFLHELRSFTNSVHNYSVSDYDANVKYDFHNRDNGDEFPLTNERNDAFSDLDTDSSDDADSSMIPNYRNDLGEGAPSSGSETDDDQMDSESHELEADMSANESSDSSQSDDRMDLSFFDSGPDNSDIEPEEFAGLTATNESISIIITNDSDSFADSSDSETYEDVSTESDQNVIIIESDSDSNSSFED